MKLRILITILALLATQAPAAETGSTFVLVHGASGGGWDWRTMEEILEDRGHTVYRPTLTGLGERMHLNAPDVGLSTHVSDIVNVILFEDLQDIALVGHSYGGMVITGVMDAIPARIRHAVFLDADVPLDGQSAADLWPDIERNHEIRDGIVHFAWLDPAQAIPRDVPQSLKTLTEPVSFDHPDALKLPATLILFVPEGVDRDSLAAHTSWHNAGQRGWHRQTLVSDHNAQRSHPQELADLLEQAARR